MKAQAMAERPDEKEESEYIDIDWNAYTSYWKEHDNAKYYPSQFSGMLNSKAYL